MNIDIVNNKELAEEVKKQLDKKINYLEGIIDDIRIKMIDIERILTNDKQ